MRARTIKPGFFMNEELAECSMQTRLTFIGLWGIADREGRLADRPKRIKAELFPYDAIDVECNLVELEQHKLIVRYSVKNERYILIPTFLKHQKPHPNEKPSEIPAPDGKNINDYTIEHQGDNNVTPRCEVDNTKDITTPAVSLLLCSSVSHNNVSHIKNEEQVPKTAPKNKRDIFTPPTAAEVQEYATEKGYVVDAEYFVNYYERQGWLLSNGRKVKNWKACLATWQSNKRTQSQSTQPAQRTYFNSAYAPSDLADKVGW